tara:strand:+ start:3007 stop:3882 length:876 start_codon:yes stop_codon:yes gene_type:complete
MICLPDDIKSNELLNTIRELSWDASKIFKSYKQEIKNSKKLNIKNFETGPVTSADIEINELIKNIIRNKYPVQKWEFLSEEDKKSNKNKIYKSKWVWIIDPLDGTKDFIKETGEYAMHLALTYEKEIILGIVLIPQKNQLWISLKDEGTWFENENSIKEYPINKKNKKLNELKILTSKSHVHQKFNSLLEKINPKQIQGMGSVGYKISSILRGDGDLYISYALPGGTSPQDWDIAAPLGLIKEAGGYFTDINGADLKFLKEGNFDQGGILIASMNSNHLEICETISKLINN